MNHGLVSPAFSTHSLVLNHDLSQMFFFCGVGIHNSMETLVEKKGKEAGGADILLLDGLPMRAIFLSCMTCCIDPIVRILIRS